MSNGSDAGTLSYVDSGHSIHDGFVAPYLVRLIVATHPFAPGVRLSIAEVNVVRIGRGEVLNYTRSHDGNDAILHIETPDSWMSSRHVELREETDGQWLLSDSDSKNGCYLNGKRCQSAHLSDGDLIHTGNTTFLFRCKAKRSHLDPADLREEELSRQLAAHTFSLPLTKTMRDLAQVAVSSVSVILGGETGTGKEVAARYLHQSSRRPGAFVAVNCGALPANLVESELFGHRKGAFSGATSDRIGLIQASDSGTLFLDEVAELPLEAQVKLLRVLQEREITPVGSTRPIPVDLRVVAATHADLEELIAAKAFRADLYARLAGVCVQLPCLCDRKEDLGMLVSALIRRNADSKNLVLEREAGWAIALYDWPRNIRELEQALCAAVAWADKGTIQLRHLPPAVAAVLIPEQQSEENELRQQLIAALRTHKGNVSATARELGKARVQIRRWCKRFALSPTDYR